MTYSATLGLFGLGTMGSALSLNILENGFALHVTNHEVEVVADFIEEAENAGLAGELHGADSLAEMVAAMAPPRAIILMIPSGSPVDETIEKLVPHLPKVTRSSTRATRTSM